MAGGNRPLILVRGFGGPDVSGEQRNAYQGFNEGTVYPGRRGENYIYEGFVLRAMKDGGYRDATNVVGYYATPIAAPPGLDGWPAELASGVVAASPAVAAKVLADSVAGTLWIYRYYDLTPRKISEYGAGLTKLVEIIRTATARAGEEFDGVDIVAHSMGGLIVRAALKQWWKTEPGLPERLVHRIVTLGTPHQGIAFQLLPRWFIDLIPRLDDAGDELAAFDPANDEFKQVGDWFSTRRILTVVGTDYRSYGTTIASAGNRLASLLDEGSLVYNHSDGLVKQFSAQLPGAPRTFVHKCHGGSDSLITSREAYEIAMRFFHGTHRVRLWLDAAEVLRGDDFIGSSEFYFGVSIKPRAVDFNLFCQKPEAENCYGPFASRHLDDDPASWAGADRLIWEGWLDCTARPHQADDRTMVFRLDVYVGERDTFGFRFSDDVIFRKQYYLQAVMEERDEVTLLVHTSQSYVGRKTDLEEIKDAAADDANLIVQPATTVRQNAEWTFKATGTGFEGTFRLALDRDPG